MTELKNKVVWITGASSGIGEALSHELVNRGSKVILSARRMEELERVKKKLWQEYEEEERLKKEATAKS